MRTQWMVLPALALAMNGGLAADDPPGTSAAVAYLDSARPGPANWRMSPDHLDYLRHRAGCGSACVGAQVRRGPERAIVNRDYIDALNLVTYGDMDVKFTGDRVKLKVRF